MAAPTIPGLENSHSFQEPPQRKEKKSIKSLLQAAILVIPNIILLIVFTYRPLTDNIRLSFYNWNISSTRAVKFIGFDNYIEWATNPTSWAIVWQTIIFTFVAVAGSIVLGLGLALLLDRNLKGRNLVRSLVFAPYVISGAAIGVAFQFVFDPRLRPDSRPPRANRH